MAHNFHDINGMLLVGVDFHMGMMPLPPPPKPMMYWEMVFAHPFILGPGQHGAVKFNGVNSVHHMHTPLLLWLHMPMIPDPLNLKWWQDWLGGSHVAWLPRTAVKIEGTSAACCVFPGSASINMDCCEPGLLPLSIVFQPGTVQTTPTLKDFLLGALAVVVQVGFDKAVAKLGDKFFKTKWGTKLRRKAYGNTRVARWMDKRAMKWGLKAGASSKKAMKVGMARMDDAIGNVVGNNPIEAGKNALDLLGIDVPAHIRAAAQNDDNPGGPTRPTLPKLLSHTTSGAYPTLSAGISAAEGVKDALKGE
jgi:hypothetical protein